MPWPPDDRVRKAFAQTARRYDDLARRRYRRIALALIEAVGLKRTERVLDVAAGSGLVARVQREKGLGEPVCLDISAELLQLAPSSPRIAADAMQIPIRDSVFDVVLCSLGIQMFANPDAATAEMIRVIKDGGRIGLTAWGENYSSDLDAAAYSEINALVQEQPDYEPQRWQVVQIIVSNRMEIQSLLKDTGFEKIEVDVRRKRSAFRSAEHYFEMLSVFPGAWARLNALGDSVANEAKQRAIEAIAGEVGHDGPFEVIEEFLIATGFK